MKLALALRNSKITQALSDKYEIVADFQREKELNEIGNLIDKPNKLIIVDTFENTTAQKLISLKENNPYLTIIYIMSDAEYTTGTKRKMARLIQNNIYDIIVGDLTLTQLCNIIENPKRFEDVEHLLNCEDEDSFKNITMISSLKPGTGKTMLSANLAVAIADYGQEKRVEGKMYKPRVLLLEGDLLNLGVSTITKVDNYDRNMLTALKKIAQNVKEDGSYTMNESEMDNMKRFVRQCLSRYKGKDNLYVMAAAEISLEDLEEISPVHFYFMVQMLANAFDVIIVDSNSAFDHQTTAALYELAGRVLLLIDNDYNNIQNNLRYIEKLTDLGYDDKLHFVVNRDLTWNMEQDCLEDLVYDTKKIGNLMIEHRIPLGDAGKIKTIEYGNKTLVETTDLPEVKEAILEVADDIWKIDYSRVEKAAEPEKKKPNKIIAALNK